MALFTCNLFAKTLYASVTVNVVLPTPDSSADFFGSDARYPEAGEKFQTLYLLHGFSADYTDWQRFSRIESYACENKIAVVMASANNSSYTDLPYGGKYFTFFTEELPKLVEAIFPLSHKRENRFVAGLSMGGFGTMKMALLRPDLYAAAASLSGGFGNRKPLAESVKSGSMPTIPTEKYRYNQYGENLEFYDENKDDVKVMLKNAVDAGVDLPKLYVCCGTEDFLYETNRGFCEYAQSIGAEITYEEGPGVHDFYFWDPYIKKILEWMPLTHGFVD